jgi:ribosome-binding factor A
MLASVVREVVAPFLRMCPPECGIVAIISVRIAPDSGYADIGISALHEPQRAVEFLTSRKQEMQKKLGSLERRVIPKIRFKVDTSNEKGDRVSDLLRKLDTEGK